MSKRIATISYEKEITDIEYDNLFNSLKSYEKNELFCNFKGQISNSNIKCKKCKTSVKDIVHTNLLVCPCCFETIYKLDAQQLVLYTRARERIDKFKLQKAHHAEIKA